MSQFWDVNLYDDKHSFVSKFGSGVIELLNPKKGELILDLGCGTGDLTNKISLSGATVEGMDASEEMIFKAREKYPDIKFFVGDAANFNVNECYDAVFSNAVLHWIKEPEKVLFCIWKALKSNGRFVAEFGGKGNVGLIINAIIKCAEKVGYQIAGKDIPWYYPSIGQYTSLMEESGFHVAYAVHFDRPTILEDGEEGLENWIHMFAGNLLNATTIQTKQEIIRIVKDELRGILFHDGNWTADYKRIRVVGIKEKQE